MIRNILFFAATFVSAGLMAQTFQFNDVNDVDIADSSYYFEDNTNELSLTKFHVKNISGASGSYTADVQEISNPKGSGLQVCYGSACYVAAGGVVTVQEIGDSSIVASGATDATFKVAPFTSGWVAGDSAVWRVIVRNVADPADTVSATITWKADLTTAVKELSPNNIKLTVYPNPVVNNLTVKYDFKIKANNAELNVYDVLGQEIVSRNLSSEKGIEKIDVSSMNSGVYFYAVKIAGKTVRTERFIVR